MNATRAPASAAMTPVGHRPERSRATDAPAIVQSVLRVFQDKHTSGLEERQAAVLKRLAQLHQDGYQLPDYAWVPSVLEAAAEKVERGFHLLEEALLVFIATLRKYANQHVVESGPLLDCVEGLARVMVRSSSFKVVRELAHTVHTFICGYEGDPEASQLARQCGDLRRYCQSLALSAEGLLSAVLTVMDRCLAIKSVQNSETDGEVKPPAVSSEVEEVTDATLGIVWDLSFMEESCGTLIGLGLLERLGRLLSATQSIRDERLSLVLETMWNILRNDARTVRSAATRHELLTSYRYLSAHYQLATAENIAALCRLYELFILGGYRQEDKEVRNDLLVVLREIARRKSAHPLFQSSGLLDLLIRSSTVLESDHLLAGDRHNYATASDEDFELKQLVWRIIQEVATCESSLQEISQSHFMRTLLLYADGRETSSPGLELWSASQLHMLRVLALSVLSTLGPVLPEVLREERGAAILLSVFAKEFENEELRRQVLECLEKCSGCPDYPTELGVLGGVHLLVRAFRSEHVRPEEKSMIVSILTNLCSGMSEENRQCFRDNNGVILIIEALTEEFSKPTDSIYIVLLLRLVWKTMLADDASLLAFIRKDGLDCLLSGFESPAAIVRPLLLSLLSEMCLKSPKAAPIVRSWRSQKTGKYASQIIVAIWEECHRKLSATEEPAPGERATPVALTGRERQAFARLNEALHASQGVTEGQSIVDLRTKAYILMEALGPDEIAGQLTLQELRCLSLLRRYPLVLYGKTWNAVREYLRAQRIRPIAADAVLIEHGLESSHNEMQRAKEETFRLAQQEENEAKDKEKEFYDGILRQKYQEIQAEYLKQQARLPKSTWKSRLETKQKKEEMLRKSQDVDPETIAALGI